MAKTLREVEELLTSSGYRCKNDLDFYVTTELPTRVYTNGHGTKRIKACLSFDYGNDCFTIHTPWAFDSKEARHKEAMLACLLTASANSPLVKTELHPRDGEVRLRIDCYCGRDGVDGRNVLRMLSLISDFADRWYPQIKNAMEKGDSAPVRNVGSAFEARLESIVRRAGGINRLEALFRLRPGNN